MKYIVKTMSRCDDYHIEYEFNHPGYKECKNLKELLEYLYDEIGEPAQALENFDEDADFFMSCDDESDKSDNSIEFHLRIIYKYQLTKKQINKREYNKKIKNIKNVDLEKVEENEDLQQAKEVYLNFLESDKVCNGEFVEKYYIEVKEVEDDVKLCLF